jgi:hypothetical protein
LLRPGRALSDTWATDLKLRRESFQAGDLAFAGLNELVESGDADEA